MSHHRHSRNQRSYSRSRSKEQYHQRRPQQNPSHQQSYQNERYKNHPEVRADWQARRRD